MKKNEKIFALCRMGLALVIAAVLLAVTGFGVVPLMQGPVEVTDGAELTEGSYVKTDLAWIMNLCGEEVKASGEAVAYYAIAPIGNRFVLLRFDAALQADIQTLCEATQAYLTGQEAVMRVYMPVKGMVVPAEEAVYSLLQQWFENNRDWMSEAGVVGPEATEELYLSAQMIEVDKAGAMSGEWTVILSVLAGLMVLYALVELCFLLPGKKEKEVTLPGAEALAAALAEKETEEITEEATEEEAEESAGEAEEAAETADEESEESKEEENV